MSVIYKIFPDLEIDLKLDSHKKTKHHDPDGLKLSGKKWKGSVSVREAVYRTFYYNCGLSYGFDESTLLYNGRPDILRKPEMDIVKEIDEICRENDIILIPL